MSVRHAEDIPVVLVSYSTRPRGGVVHTLQLAEALHRLGEPVSIAALGDPAEGFFRPTAVPHTILPSAPASTLEERVDTWRAALSAGLATLVHGPCILHAQDCIAARAAVRLRDMGVPVTVVRTVHHVDDFTTPALVECQRRSIVEPDRILVDSRYWQHTLHADFGVDAGIVTNGVDTARFSGPPPIDPAQLRTRFGVDGRFTFLTVGGIEPRKGSAVLVEAFARVRETVTPSAALVVVGDNSFQDHTPYRRQVLARVGELGLEVGRDILFLGTVSDDEVTSWYHAADAFVFPSITEGWGLAVLEAMTAGLPVIVTDIPVFREYLSEDSALLVPCGDGVSLSAAMSEVMTQPALRRCLGAAGRATATRYSWDDCAAEHRSVYRRLRTNLSGCTHVPGRSTPTASR